MKGSRHLTIVIKLGTSSIVDEKTHEPRLSILSLIVETAVKLLKDGHRVIIVSSGAIGVGLRRMDVEKRPKTLPQVQALAAIGQSRLMSLWDSLFGHMRQPIAQILLTRNDIADRTQYLNAQNTFTALLNMGVVPVVNENDTIAVSEIKFGDNDTLSAITAAMVSADYLFLMTDVDCLYTTNPRIDPNAQPITTVSDISSLAAHVSSAGSLLGTGGMSTKIVAARLATSAGITTVITRSSKPGNVREIVHYDQLLRLQAQNQSLESAVLSPIENPALPHPPLHTRFTPSATPVRDRSFWLLHGLAPHGTVYIDEGAHKALHNKAGLLPVGVVDVEGHFAQQEAVKLVVVRRSHPPAAPRPRMPASEMEDLPNKGSLSGTETPDAAPPTPGTPAAALCTGGLGAYESGLEFPLSDSQPDSPVPLQGPLRGLSPGPSHTAILAIAASAAVIDASAPPREIGRALVNYSSTEILRIKGLQSSEIEGILGYADSEYVALRENVSLARVEDGRDRKRRENGKGSSIASMGDLARFA